MGLGGTERLYHVQTDVKNKTRLGSLRGEQVFESDTSRLGQFLRKRVSVIIAEDPRLLF